ncbi:MAG: peptide chain release factor N(5)-glutamine methyltransferase [Candidatus Omnitrophota bacterium]
MTEKELILTNLLECSRHELYFKNKPLSKEQERELSKILKLRCAGVPLQYILGFSEFMGIKFKVDKRALIPRPETEILVETAIKYVSSIPACGGTGKYQVSSKNILDIGTGSGCIAVSLAKFLPNSKITAVDISQKALEIARENAGLNGIADQIEFMQSDLFSKFEIPALPVGRRISNFDIIVSNPPYICSDEIKKLPKEVQYEPKLALDGGCDGLNYYRRLIKESPSFLGEGGLLIMELGIGQLEQVKNISEQSKRFIFIEAIKDYNKINRVIVLRRDRENG